MRFQTHRILFVWTTLWFSQIARADESRLSIAVLCLPENGAEKDEKNPDMMIREFGRSIWVVLLLKR